jgi:hypothetical protein
MRVAGMHQGVLWYRLTDALQEELRKTLVEAMRLLRINVGSQQHTAEPPRPGNAPLPGESEVIRGLEPGDIQFIKDKLVGSDRSMWALRYSDGSITLIPRVHRLSSPIATLCASPTSRYFVKGK